MGIRRRGVETDLEEGIRDLGEPVTTRRQESEAAEAAGSEREEQVAESLSLSCKCTFDNEN